MNSLIMECANLFFMAVGIAVTFTVLISTIAITLVLLADRAQEKRNIQHTRKLIVKDKD